MKQCAVCLLFALSLIAVSARAQAPARYDADREKAFYLIEQNNFKEALPLLEKLHISKPEDTKVMQYLALALVANAATGRDSQSAQKEFKRARELTEKAQKLGDNSELVQMLLARIPPDGKTAEEKPRTPAEEALHAGEGAFRSGEMGKAIAEYERAAQLDPKLYEAPLFIGDAYFKQGKIEEAGKAYARAIAINPDRDTAYRFWGNVLLQNGKLDEAREKFVEAVICEPYARTTWQFLSRWAQYKQIQLSHPRIDIPTSVERKDDQNINILISPNEKKDGSEAWTVYSLTRAGWMSDKKFSEAFPNEKQYRHSLREEFDALRLTAESLEERLKQKELKESALDVSIANLLKLHRAGLLEAYILFAQVDEGIAKDYLAYRQANRAKLRQYLSEYVAPNK